MNRQLGSVRDVSRETLDQLEAFHNLVLKWNKKINLVSKASTNSLWSRHIEDSAQIAEFAQNKRVWCDIGSGGGFPGLIVAIMARAYENTPEIILIESDVRKCAFLREASRQLALNTKIVAKRIEEVDPLSADIVSARALADMSTLLAYAAHHLAPAGTALLMKGATWRKEVEDARQHWSFDLVAHKSKTDPASAILEVKGIHRV